jgi:hypothetical protein
MGAFRWVTLAVLVSSGAFAARPAAAQNAIAVENALRGDGGWRLTQRAAPGELEAYAGAASVERGESLDLHVRADGTHTVTWKLYRMGWYGAPRGASWRRAGRWRWGRRRCPRPPPTPASSSAAGR